MCAPSFTMIDIYSRGPYTPTDKKRMYVPISAFTCRLHTQFYVSGPRCVVHIDYICLVRFSQAECVKQQVLTPQ